MLNTTNTLRIEQLTSGESRREEILASAIRNFAARGFDGASTREIAREAGAKHSLLFYHFRSKADLYLAAVVDQLERLGNSIQTALASERDPASRLRTYVEVYYECFTTREPGLSVCLRELSGLPVDLARQIADAHGRHSMGILQAIIADGIQEGVFRPLDARACATAITGILHIFLRMRPTARSRFASNEAVRQVLDVYCAGLLAMPVESDASNVVSTLADRSKNR
ncbi:MAG: TetR/AcrR family transcriptional regulator [Chloroflexi bacterium]|nr:TetR/AcrR family transcriptional regulator [Chloroflexota bacterium]